MAKKPYSIWKRRLASNNIVYYARFRLDDYDEVEERYRSCFKKKK